MTMKFLDVPMSGSREAQTFSRNRYGQYVRTRAIPVNPSSSFQVTQRARFAQLTADYRDLTDLQRAGWAALGASMFRTDALGQTYSLTGLQAYISVNGNNLDAGNSVVSDAPSLATPAALTTITLTFSTSAMTVAYTATPLGAGERLFVYCSPQRSEGRNFEGDLRLVHVSAAAAASPADIESAYVARFGTPVIGNRIFAAAHRYSGGFLSAALSASAVIAA